MLPKMRPYVKSYDCQTKWMYFLNKEDNLLENYITIWDKVSTDIKKGSDSKSVYNEKFLKTKVKSYSDESTDFHDKEIPKAVYNYNFLRQSLTRMKLTGQPSSATISRQPSACKNIINKL